MDGLACYDSDASASHGGEHGDNDNDTDNEDASLDDSSSSVGDGLVVGSAHIKMAAFTTNDELPDTSASSAAARAVHSQTPFVVR